MENWNSNIWRLWCREQVIRSKNHMPGLQKFELFTNCLYEFLIPNPDFWAFFSVKTFKTTNNNPSDWSNNLWKIQDYLELEIRENMWWTDSVVHQKSCEHRLFQLLSKHYFKRFKTRLLLHPSSVAQNHSPYWWCHIPKVKKTLKGKLFSYQPQHYHEFFEQFSSSCKLQHENFVKT